MSLVKLAFPPGIVRPGTVYDAMGRWYDCNLVRWHEGALQPIGGWSQLTAAADTGNAPVRGMYAWRRNNGDVRLAFGVYDAFYVYVAGTVYNVTISDFTAGGASASGSFTSRSEANSWQIDAFGEDLVAVAYSDGRVLYYDSSSMSGDLTALANAPTGCKGVVVTPERFVVALAASGDGRLVKWADQEDATDWTATKDNQAGGFTLAGNGQIMAGRRSKNETLIWTDTDLWTMRYIGGTLVYSFGQIGSVCGAISRRSMTVIDGQAFWMGTRGFFRYDGAVHPIPCEVGDYVFNRLNRAQASLIAAVPNTDFNEVSWLYPSTTGSNEVDSIVTYNYLSGHWTIGSGLSRTDGVDRGFLEYPIWAASSGATYEHEKGTTYQDTDGSALVPFIESGPLEIGSGDRLMGITSYIPDEKTLGQVNTRLYSRLYPTGTETTHGPFTNTNPTNVRITARQVRVRHTQVTGGWRLGTPRLEVKPGSKR